MQISTIDVIRCVNPQAIMACERNKLRSEKFFVNGGPVIESCKTPLTQNALSCLFFRKTKSAEHIVSDASVFFPFISNNVAIGFLTVEILRNGDF